MIAAKLFIVCCLATITFSLPLQDTRPVIDEENTAIPEPAEDIIEERVHMRTKRATCDLLSFQSKWITVNDSACAAHCLAMFKGFKGGYCKNSVCHCRK